MGLNELGASSVLLLFRTLLILPLIVSSYRGPITEMGWAQVKIVNKIEGFLLSDESGALIGL